MSTASFVCGISLVDLSPNSLIQAEVISTEDGTHSQFLNVTITDTLQAAFVQLADLLPQDLRLSVVAVPAYFTEPEWNSITKAAQSLTKFKISNNITVAQWALRHEDYPERNELAIEIGLLGASARLLTTEVEEGMRLSSEEKNIDLRGDFDDALFLIELLVNPILELLQEIPTVCGSQLERIVVVDSTFGRKSTVITAVAKLLESKFEPAVEVLLKSDIVRYTAELALYRYKDSLVERQYLCIFNVAPLSIGIAKADGFALTIIPRNNTIPSRKTAILTTSEDNQTTATIRVIAGLAPRVEDNFIMGEFILDGLSPRPGGLTRIQIEIRLEDDRTLVLAEELDEDGHPVFQGASARLEINADDGIGKNEIEGFFERYPGLQYDVEAENAEKVWADKDAQGALPK